MRFATRLTGLWKIFRKAQLSGLTSYPLISFQSRTLQRWKYEQDRLRRQDRSLRSRQDMDVYEPKNGS
jgi:hypothetical protein